MSATLCTHCGEDHGPRVIQAYHVEGGARFCVPECFVDFEEGDVLLFVDRDLEPVDGDYVRTDNFCWWRIERVSASSMRLVEKVGFWRNCWQELRVLLLGGGH